MAKGINLLPEKAEEDNSALEISQLEADDTIQNDLNSISETKNDSAESKSSVQPVSTETGSNDPVIFSSSSTEKIIDNDAVDRIKSQMAQANPDSFGKKRIEINLDSAKADFPIVNDLITYIHNKNNDCDVFVNCSGAVELSLIPLVSACKFGSRNAQFTTTFPFFENPKHSNKKRKELSANEEIALSVISQFSSKSSSIIKKVMLEGKTIVAGDAKKLGIIDNVTGLEDRDASERSAAATRRKKKKELTPA